MAAMSNYLRTAVLNWVKGSAFAAPPAAVYLGLFDGDPTAAGTGGAEVTTTIRPGGRVALPFGAVAGGAMANSAVVDFGNAAGAADYSHVGVFDAAAGGNLIAFGPVTGGPKTASGGTQVYVPVGDLTVSLS